MMIETNRLFETTKGLLINYFQDYIIPYSFSQTQNNLIVSIFNTSNLNQIFQGYLMPFSEYSTNGKLEYFCKSINVGNQLVSINPIDDFKLKFRPNRNGDYLITIDEILNINNNTDLITLQTN